MAKYYIEKNSSDKIITKGITVDDATIESPLIEVTEEEFYLIEQWKPTIDIKLLKPSKIIKSKQQLAEFLQNNSLQFTDGKFYSVTAEKQTLLANAIQVYQMKIQAGLLATLKWNATGEECTEWTLEELSTLALAIAEYVEPLVAHQQSLEVQIRNATTLEELEGIEINYEMV